MNRCWREVTSVPGTVSFLPPTLADEGNLDELVFLLEKRNLCLLSISKEG